MAYWGPARPLGPRSQSLAAVMRPDRDFSTPQRHPIRIYCGQNNLTGQGLGGVRGWQANWAVHLQPHGSVLELDAPSPDLQVSL
jgi:hypothetical protein